MHSLNQVHGEGLYGAVMPWTGVSPQLYGLVMVAGLWLKTSNRPSPPDR